MFKNFSDATLIYAFYNMPSDKTQLLAVEELYSRKWKYHVQKNRWFRFEDGKWKFFEHTAWRMLESPAQDLGEDVFFSRAAQQRKHSTPKKPSHPSSSPSS